jgi:hypothetical protein
MRISVLSWREGGREREREREREKVQQREPVNSCIPVLYTNLSSTTVYYNQQGLNEFGCPSN